MSRTAGSTARPTCERSARPGCVTGMSLREAYEKHPVSIGRALGDGSGRVTARDRVRSSKIREDEGWGEKGARLVGSPQRPAQMPDWPVALGDPREVRAWISHVLPGRPPVSGPTQIYQVTPWAV